MSRKLELIDRSVKFWDWLRKPFLNFLIGRELTSAVFELRPKIRTPLRWRLDTKIKIICFLASSPVFVIVCVGIFLDKREQWFVGDWGILKLVPTIGFGVIVGLLAGLIIGVGLVANLLISYSYSIEAKVSFLRKDDSKPTVVGLSKNERDDRWKEYALHIDLYKYYLELGLKANLFFYVITGTIVGFYLTHREVQYKKVSLLLPILMSLALGGIFLHGAILWIRVSRIIRETRIELNIKKAPDINLMTVLLVVFGFITLIVGVAMVLLVIVT